MDARALILLGLGLAGVAHAETRDPLVTQLIAAKQFEQAYAQTMRQAFAVPQGEARLSQLNQAGDILWQGGLYSQAALHYQAIDEPSLAATGAAYSLYKLGHWENAIMAGQKGNSPEAQYIVAAAYLQLEEPAEAYSRLTAIAPGTSVSTDAQAVAATMKKWGVMPQRSPTVAGVMSAVIPGSGQAYAGAWSDGLAALLVNGALIGAGWQLAQRDQWFAVGAVGLFELGFYGGNIMSAVNNAKRFNRQAWSNRLGETLGGHEPKLTPQGQTLTHQARQE